MATQIGSHRSCFRQMANTLSLAQMTNWCRCGMQGLATSGREYWTPIAMSNTQDGFSLLMVQSTLCLCHLRNICLTLPMSSLYHALLVPMWTSHMPHLALNGRSVIICSPYFIHYLLHILIIAIMISFACLYHLTLPA